MALHPAGKVTGSVYKTNAAVADLVNVGFPHEYVWDDTDILVTDETGHFSPGGTSSIGSMLRGQCARTFDAKREADGSGQIGHHGAPVFHWNTVLGIADGDMDFRNLMGYYHVTDAHARFCSLLGESIFAKLDGQDWAHELDVYVNDQADDQDTACWNAEEGRIRFGEGVPYILDSLGIFHEYAHLVIDAFTYPVVFPSLEEDPLNVKEREAISVCEAFADYLACTVKDYPKVLEGEGPYERDLRLVHEYQPSEGVYSKSLALSSALWALRTDEDTVGREAMDNWLVGSLWRLRAAQHRVREFGLVECRLMLLEIDQDDPSSLGSRAGQINQAFNSRSLPKP